MRRGAVVLLALAFPASASAHKAQPFLTIARAEAVIVHMARSEAGTNVSVTKCQRVSATSIACNLTETVEWESQGLTELTERVTVRIAHGRLAVICSMRGRAAPAPTFVVPWGPWNWR